MVDDHETLPSHKPYTRSKIGLEAKEVSKRVKVKHDDGVLVVEDSWHQADSTRSRSHT